MRIEFSDFQFFPSNLLKNTERASLLLQNGYTVHVIRGEKACGTYGAPYELTASPIPSQLFDDSVGYLSEKQVEQLANEINNLQSLKSA